MAKLTEAGYRFPEPAEGVQVNFCKNIRCTAFGVPEKLYRVRRSKFATPEAGDYIREGAADDIRLKCSLCGSKNPVRSNKAIVEELHRIGNASADQSLTSCPSPDCENHGVPLWEPGRYARFGKTKAGTPRWRCNGCKKTFSEAGKPLLRQRMPHKNRDVFMLLVNKSPLSRITEITGLDIKTVYGKIDFISRQCKAFVADRERRLYEGMPLPKMYIAVDRQVHNVNWSSRKDRRNIQLSAIGSADLESGYVFGLNLNFDPLLNPDDVEREAVEYKDFELSEGYRRFARLWLSTDFEAATIRAAAISKRRSKLPLAVDEDALLVNEISATYDEGETRPDVEAKEPTPKDTKLPALGMLVKDQYTMHAHFQMLAKMLKSAEKVRAYLDQDSGIRAAFLGAFAARVKERTADAWYVSVLKGATIHQKERAVQVAKAKLKDAEARYPTLGKNELLLALMKEEMTRGLSIGQFEDLWLNHPLPNMSEPAKKVCWLTNLEDYDTDHTARLYLKASLHAVDRFFMQTRRLLSLAERSIVTASSDRRVWHGYSAYKPENLAKVLEIFRVYYNYCKVGNDKKTPAMRLGLARAPIAVEDVLYFSDKR
jgi:transposase-like protein